MGAAISERAHGTNNPHIGPIPPGDGGPLIGVLASDLWTPAQRPIRLLAQSRRSPTLWVFGPARCPGRACVALPDAPRPVCPAGLHVLFGRRVPRRARTRLSQRLNRVPRGFNIGGLAVWRRRGGRGPRAEPVLHEPVAGTQFVQRRGPNEARAGAWSFVLPRGR